MLERNFLGRPCKKFQSIALRALRWLLRKTVLIITINVILKIYQKNWLKLQALVDFLESTFILGRRPIFCL